MAAYPDGRKAGRVETGQIAEKTRSRRGQSLPRALTGKIPPPAIKTGYPYHIRSTTGSPAAGRPRRQKPGRSRCLRLMTDPGLLMTDQVLGIYSSHDANTGSPIFRTFREQKPALSRQAQVSQHRARLMGSAIPPSAPLPAPPNMRPTSCSRRHNKSTPQALSARRPK